MNEISPSLQKTNELSTENLVNKTVKQIESALEVDGSEVLAEYIKENKDYFEELIALGKGRSPERLANEVVRDYKAKAFDKLSKKETENNEQSATEKAVKKIQEKAKAAKETSTTVNAKRDTETKSIASQIIEDIEADGDQLIRS